MFDIYEGQATKECWAGHQYPALAGDCPDHPSSMTQILVSNTRPPTTIAALSPELERLGRAIIKWVGSSNVKRHNHKFGYHGRSKGVVNHIPVCKTLEQLTNYFNSTGAQGSTNYGVGRDAIGELEAGGYRFPVSQVHHYLNELDNVSPWAQGIIQESAACKLGLWASVRGMASGEPNGAFTSIENVAMAGTDGLTDAQFNSNVILRARDAARFGYQIGPLTQGWHGEIDNRDRCFDPGWQGAWEDEMQSAAQGVLAGNYARMRGAVKVNAPPPSVDWRAWAVQYRASLAREFESLGINIAMYQQAITKDTALRQRIAEQLTRLDQALK